MTGNEHSGRSAPRRAAATSPPPENTEELRRNIAHTREELGATVEALAAKADIAARTKRRVRRTRATVRDEARRRLSAVQPSAHGNGGGEEPSARASGAGMRAPARTGAMVAAAVAVTAVTAAVIVVRRRRARTGAMSRAPLPRWRTVLAGMAAARLVGGRGGRGLRGGRRATFSRPARLRAMWPRAMRPRSGGRLARIGGTRMGPMRFQVGRTGRARRRRSSARTPS